MKKSNIGTTGPESIRINKTTIDDLPLGQGNEAKMGLKDFLKTHKETKANNIKAKYPKHKIDFLKARVQECHGNIKRIKNFKLELKANIAEYRQLIKDNDIRESELAKLDVNDPADKDQIKALKLQYPPYNIEALNQQIDQFEESIERCDDVIEQDYDSIAEIKEVLALVNQREKELANL